MPNWVQTEIELRGSDADIKSVIDFIKNEKGDVDFTKIVPYPKYWECPEKYLVLPSDIQKQGSDPVDNTNLYANMFHINVMQDLPYLDWYTWQIDNWGTKGNACECYINSNYICYQTAWSFSEPILEKLSELFPNVEFLFKYADEDLGCNCGSGVATNGNVTFDDLSENESMELAITLWGCEEDYEFVDGEWKYIDEED
jgi:hypothetical protein